MAGNVSEELARLAQLRDSGVLTQDEFDRQKALVLAGGTAAPVAPTIAPKKKGGALKGCLGILVVLIVLGVVGSMITGGKSASGGSAASTASVAPPLEVTADQIANAYQSNEARAQKDYGDRPLLVSGTIDSIDLDISNSPVVHLKTSNFIPAAANLDDASKPKASELTKGARIKLLCQNVSEVISIPQLADCAIQ